MRGVRRPTRPAPTTGSPDGRRSCRGPTPRTGRSSPACVPRCRPAGVPAPRRTPPGGPTPSTTTSVMPAVRSGGFVPASGCSAPHGTSASGLVRIPEEERLRTVLVGEQAPAVRRLRGAFDIPGEVRTTCPCPTRATGRSRRSRGVRSASSARSCSTAGDFAGGHAVLISMTRSNMRRDPSRGTERRRPPPRAPRAWRSRGPCPRPRPSRATAFRRPRAPRRADRRPAATPPRRAPTPDAAPARASRQRMIARSTAGSRSRTTSDGGVIPDCSRFANQLGEIRALERAPASGEELVEHEPERVEVAARRDLAAGELLGRHVGRRARRGAFRPSRRPGRSR